MSIKEIEKELGIESYLRDLEMQFDLLNADLNDLESLIEFIVPANAEQVRIAMRVKLKSIKYRRDLIRGVEMKLIRMEKEKWMLLNQK